MRHSGGWIVFQCDGGGLGVSYAKERGGVGAPVVEELGVGSDLNFCDRGGKAPVGGTGGAERIGLPRAAQGKAEPEGWEEGEGCKEQGVKGAWAERYAGGGGGGKRVTRDACGRGGGSGWCGRGGGGVSWLLRAG